MVTEPAPQPANPIDPLRLRAMLRLLVGSGDMTEMAERQILRLPGLDGDVS